MKAWYLFILEGGVYLCVPVAYSCIPSREGVGCVIKGSCQRVQERCVGSCSNTGMCYYTRGRKVPAPRGRCLSPGRFAIFISA